MAVWYVVVVSKEPSTKPVMQLIQSMYSLKCRLEWGSDKISENVHTVTSSGDCEQKKRALTDLGSGVMSFFRRVAFVFLKTFQSGKQVRRLPELERLPPVETALSFRCSTIIASVCDQPA